MKEFIRKKWMTAVQVILIGFFAFLFTFNDWFYTLDVMEKDIVCQRPRSVNQAIKIIAIDEETLTELGPYGTWSREIYARMLDILGEYPSVIGFDIFFMGNLDEEGDRAFKQALSERDNVVMTSHLIFESKYTINDENLLGVNGLNVSDAEYPFIGSDYPNGFANISSDSDGAVRSLVPYFDYNGVRQKAFSNVVYEEYCNKNNITPKEPLLDINGKHWIYYAGKPYEYEVISLKDVLNEKIDPRIFTNSIVLVGAYAPGLRDQFAVPNSSNQMYGVEIHANIIQSLMDERYPVPIGQVWGALLTLVLAIGAFFAFRKLHIKLGTVVFVLLEVTYTIAGVLLYTKGNCALPMIYAQLFIFVAYITTLAVGYIREVLEKKKISGAFRKYVAPQVVDDIMKTGQYKIKLGGENRDIAVLFVDIRGFTPLSESLQPEQVVEILNEYLNLTTGAIFANNGTLDKFIGDATMAVFNAPFDLDDYVFRAVCAAYDIVEGAKKLEETCKERFGKEVAFGVGVNCGPAVVGNIGCDFRMDYTAIGDTVNTAARLEANAKRAQVLISQAVYNQVKDRIEAEPIGEIPLKGKSKGVFVYSLLGVHRDDKS